MSIKKILREALIKEYLNRDMVSLKSYFRQTEEEKKSYLPHMYSYEFEDFLDRYGIEFTEPTHEFYNGDGELEAGDPYEHYEIMDWLETNNKELYNQFAEYLYEYISDYTLNIPDSDYPAWSFFDDNPRIIKNEWLIHFTDEANSIAQDGFTYGVDEIDKLGLTTHLGEFDKKYGGFNFSYTLKDFYRYGNKGYNNYKYGSEAVIFKASGLEIYHNSDHEPQTIFYGNTATNIIPITQGEEAKWCIRSIEDSRVFYESDDLREVVSWVSQNYHQYRKKL